ncbi:MAG: histidine phosphatase family protein [Rhodoferax sp.]|nr:histidine phosphatase family protein [Betaproteobacteria bacterium]NCN97446.1 histidine phosphatase family protein [Rhodoferax sp.]OIP21388.1 MAG: histidine phosphatase family protein [Comamonadaceae bacterium CG2_30_57_122]PJC21188.1 MAG: histidine phosphatase family protein [Comamonadaceae bacterium CG_4_9_14_0_8_um_filter_57_21]NCP82561.1 histidine phosphatase family protein [Rhodoferax sp.]
MDLILWRHAQAQDAPPGCDDASRALTHKGEGQAARIAAWLDRQLPESTRVLVSPARRAEQTAKALGRKYKLRDELVPDSSAEELLALLKWSPETAAPHKGAVLLVGHQPMLGQLAARLLGTAESVCDIRKGAVWWLRSRYRDGQLHVALVAVVSPDLI